MLQAKTWQGRDRWLAYAYEIAIRMFNALGIMDKIPEQTSIFYDRPFRVIWAGKVAGKVIDQIEDPVIKKRASRSLIGGIDLFSDNTDLLEDSAFQKILRRLFLI